MSSEESKLSILKAAIKAFSTKGFDSVSLREIAKEACVNHAIIRYHFGSKNDLWLAVFQKLLTDMMDLRVTHPFDKDAGDLKAEFRKFTKTRVAYISENPELLKIVLLEFIEGGPRFNQIDTMMKMFFNGTIKIVQKMQEVGIIRDFQMKDMYFIIPSFLGGRFMYPNINEDYDGQPITTEEAVEAHTELMMNLVYKD